MKVFVDITFGAMIFFLFGFALMWKRCRRAHRSDQL
ncbi:hypothetical protein [Paenibacillus elgii]